MMVCLAVPTLAQAGASELATSIGSSFEGKTMSSLDSKKPYLANFSVTIEHSISGRSTTRSFKSFAALETWLTKREHDALPARNSNDFKGCRKSVCTFDTQPILHNNLYLKRVSLGSTKGRVVVKSIRLLDGD